MRGASAKSVAVRMKLRRVSTRKNSRQGQRSASEIAWTVVTLECCESLLDKTVAPIRSAVSYSRTLTLLGPLNLASALRNLRA
jgi:hypothetical protein